MLNWPASASLYLVLALGAAIAFAWIITRRHGRGRHAPQVREGLLGKEWRKLEPLLQEAFRLQGYQVIESLRDVPRADGEMSLRRDRQTFLVQCREWNASKVGVEVVHALQQAMSTRGAAGGFVLTTGRFARDAVAYASACNVRLIDGPALQGLVDKAKAARSAQI